MQFGIKSYCLKIKPALYCILLILDIHVGGRNLKGFDAANKIESMKIIRNKEEYYLVMSEIELFLEKGLTLFLRKRMSNWRTLSQAAESWELNEYPMPAQPEIKDILVLPRIQLNPLIVKDTREFYKDQNRLVQIPRVKPAMNEFQLLHFFRTYHLD